METTAADLPDDIDALKAIILAERILQADAYGGYGKLYAADRKPGPIAEALCWAHARRKFFELADLAATARRKAKGKKAVVSPLALEAVRRIDVLFDIECDINGLSTEARLVTRQERSAPLVAELESWMRAERAKLSCHADVAEAMDYMLKRWESLPASLATGGSASPTMPSSARCVVLPWAENLGSSAVRTEAVGAPRPCTA